MKKVFSENLKVAVDIGTTKIVVLISKIKNDGSIEILASGKAASLGLKRGVVVDVEKTVNSIKLALQEAEFVGGVSIEHAVIGISGSHIQSFNSHGAVPIKKRIVQESDIAAVLQAAQAVAIAEGQQILHVLPRFYRIDNSDRIQNPIGMSGVRLETEVHIITASVAAVQNLISCCERAGLKVDDIVLEHIASALSVCSQDELDLGVGILDIGGGTSDFAVYQHGAIVHTHVIPVAGNMFTSDVAIGLQTTIQEAERIKEMHGSAEDSIDHSLEEISILKVHGLSSSTIHKKDIASILQPRSEELFSMLHRVIRDHSLYEYMITGLVLTGGGSLLQGIPNIAYKKLLVPVRVGKPHVQHYLPQSLSSPVYATAYGLILYAWKGSSSHALHQLQGPMMSRVFQRMKMWVADFF